MSNGTTFQRGAKPAPIKSESTEISKSSGETVISYVPLGEREEIHLTLARTKKFLCVPTRSGKMPTDEQVVKYMMLCKAQSLNPWVNDAYLVGYDGKDGPTFSLITAHQALLKRAEASKDFDGMESGVIVFRDDVITERPGDLILKGETLIGGWARVYRKDRRIPSYDALNIETFSTGRSRWAADPSGMIVKCSEASALRKAFPSTLAAMYCREEMDRNRDDVAPVTHTPPDRLNIRVSHNLPPMDTVEPPQAEDFEAEPEAGESTATDWRAKLLGMVHRATTGDDLDEYLRLAVDHVGEIGDINQDQYEEIKTAIAERRNEL